MFILPRAVGYQLNLDYPGGDLETRGKLLKKISYTFRKNPKKSQNP